MIIEILQYVAGVLVLVGALFCALAGLGILRFVDIYTRLHAASKAGTLGVGLLFIAVVFASFDITLIIRAVGGLLFVVMTSPLAAHLLARAALRTDMSVKVIDMTNGAEVGSADS